MKYIPLLLLLAGCSGSMPFVELGTGYGLAPDTLYEAGTDRTVDQQGAIGTYGVGIEFERHSPWYQPTSCGYRHRSYLNIKPEIVTDTLYCQKRFYGKRMR